MDKILQAASNVSVWFYVFIYFLQFKTTHFLCSPHDNRNKRYTNNSIIQSLCNIYQYRQYISRFHTSILFTATHRCRDTDIVKQLGIIWKLSVSWVWWYIGIVHTCLQESTITYQSSQNVGLFRFIFFSE